jgi:hypothetical protein
MGVGAAEEAEGEEEGGGAEGGDELPGDAWGGRQAVANSRTASDGAKRIIRWAAVNIGLPSPKVVPVQPPVTGPVGSR